MKKLWIAQIFAILFAAFALFLTFDTITRFIALKKYEEYKALVIQRSSEISDELYSEYLQLEEEYDRLTEELEHLGVSE